MRTSMVVSFLLYASFSEAVTLLEDPAAVANKYLAALANPKADSNKAYLLGGMTIDAMEARANSPHIVSKGTPRGEDGELADVAQAVAALDTAGLKFIEGAAAWSGIADPNAKIDFKAAQTMAETTRQLRYDLIRKYPVFADVMRVDKMVYWHPRNPARVWFKRAGTLGKYHIDYVSYTVESKEAGKTKTWPLRLVRLKSDTNDTGYKVLPASDWDPE